MFASALLRRWRDCPVPSPSLAVMCFPVQQRYRNTPSISLRQSGQSSEQMSGRAKRYGAAVQPSRAREVKPDASPEPNAAGSKLGVFSVLKIAVGVIAMFFFLYVVQRATSNPVLMETLVFGAINNPTAAIPLFAAANIVGPLLLLPAGPFLLLAGGIWGMSRGLAISATATFVSNILAFVIGRNLLRKRISGYVTHSIPTFPAIQAAILAEGWRLVLMLRLSPILPDSVMNYTLSLTDISFNIYAVATAISTAAWSLLYLYLGAASQDIVATLKGGVDKADGADGGTGGAVMSRLNIAVIGVSAALALGAVAYMGKVIKRAIAKAAAESGDKGGVKTE